MARQSHVQAPGWGSRRLETRQGLLEGSRANRLLPMSGAGPEHPHHGARCPKHGEAPTLSTTASPSPADGQPPRVPLPSPLRTVTCPSPSSSSLDIISFIEVEFTCHNVHSARTTQRCPVYSQSCATIALIGSRPFASPRKETLPPPPTPPGPWQPPPHFLSLDISHQRDPTGCGLWRLAPVTQPHVSLGTCLTHTSTVEGLY